MKAGYLFWTKDAIHSGSLVLNEHPNLRASYCLFQTKWDDIAHF